MMNSEYYSGKDDITATGKMTSDCGQLQVLLGFVLLFSLISRYCNSEFSSSEGETVMSNIIFCSEHSYKYIRLVSHV